MTPIYSIKILGTTFNNKITRDENCPILTKKENAQMQLLRKVWSFCSSVQEMVHLWQIYCLSILKKSYLQKKISMTKKEQRKVLPNLFCKTTIKHASNILHLETLDSRKTKLTLKFAMTK